MEENNQTLEEYQHRTVDKDGNPDDKFTEQEALDLAAKQGIYFIDTFYVVPVGTMAPSGTAYATRQEAEEALAGRSDHSIMQTREQKV